MLIERPPPPDHEAEGLGEGLTWLRPHSQGSAASGVLVASLALVLPRLLSTLAWFLVQHVHRTWG